MSYLFIICSIYKFYLPIPLKISSEISSLLVDSLILSLYTIDIILWYKILLTSFWAINFASLIAQLVKNPPAVQETPLPFLVGRIPWRTEWLPTPVFWPGEFHELYSPWSCKELDTTEQLSLGL